MPSLEVRVLDAMRNCPICRKLSPPEREEHLQESIAEVEKTQARTLRPFPARVWPQGRPPLDHEPPTRPTRKAHHAPNR